MTACLGKYAGKQIKGVRVKRFGAAVMAVGFVLSCSAARAESATLEMVKAKVGEVAALVQAKGKAGAEEARAIAQFADTYVWVHSADSVMVMHPVKPAMEGKSNIDMQDANGKFVFVAFNEMAGTNGAGWVSYVWPKPGQTEPSPKVSYVKQVKGSDGVEYIIGSGVYDVTPEQVKAAFPVDNVD